VLVALERVVEQELLTGNTQSVHSPLPSFPATSTTAHPLLQIRSSGNQEVHFPLDARLQGLHSQLPLAVLERCVLHSSLKFSRCAGFCRCLLQHLCVFASSLSVSHRKTGTCLQGAAKPCLQLGSRVFR